LGWRRARHPSTGAGLGRGPTGCVRPLGDLGACRYLGGHGGKVPIRFGGSCRHGVFDLLGVDGTDVTGLPFSERRALLEKLVVGGSGWTLSETFEDGEALYGAVCEHGFEGVVA
jgi:ATP dependent DNA ligase domain